MYIPKNQLPKPNPEDFGLSSEIIRFFEKEPVEELEGMLNWILGWISFFCVCFFYPPKFLDYSFAWPLLLLYYVPGYFIGFILNRLYNIVYKSKVLNHKDYPKYLKYIEAKEKYRRYLFALEKKALEEERQKRREEERKLRAQLDWWEKLDGWRFERELGKFLSEKGYKVEVTSGSGDGGVDLFLKKNKQAIIVQCKAHQNYISPGSVRDLYGTLIHYDADEAWLVSTSGYHKGATEFAENKPIKLLTIKDIISMN